MFAYPMIAADLLFPLHGDDGGGGGNLTGMCLCSSVLFL